MRRLRERMMDDEKKSDDDDDGNNRQRCGQSRSRNLCGITVRAIHCGLQGLTKALARITLTTERSTK